MRVVSAIGFAVGLVVAGYLIGVAMRRRPPPPFDFAACKLALVERLWTIARGLDVPIFVLDEWDLWSFKHGCTCAGQYRRGGLVHIRILRKYMNCPWVLAHEIGHHRLHEREHTEDEADREGGVLLLSLLRRGEERMAPVIRAAMFRAPTEEGRGSRPVDGRPTLRAVR